MLLELCSHSSITYGFLKEGLVLNIFFIVIVLCVGVDVSLFIVFFRGKVWIAVFKLRSGFNIVVEFVISVAMHSVIFVTIEVAFERLLIVVGLGVVAFNFFITGGSVGTSGELGIITIIFNGASRATFYYLWVRAGGFQVQVERADVFNLWLKLSEGPILMRLLDCILEREVVGREKLAIPL